MFEYVVVGALSLAYLYATISYSEVARLRLRLTTAVTIVREWICFLDELCYPIGDFVHRHCGEFKYGGRLGPDEIRLIVLNPWRPFCRPSCELVRFGIRSQPIYDACSYVWGDPTPIETVVINGQVKRLARSAFNVLYEQQSLFRKRFLWIDAVCINQEDNAEKVAQIQLMDSIFREAEKVDAFVAVSPKASHIHFLFDWITSNRTASLLAKGKITEAHLKNSDRYRSQLTLPVYYTRSHWYELWSLMGEPYFSRMWILQEVALGRQVVVRHGRLRISWDRLVSIAEQFTDAGNIDDDLPSAAQHKNKATYEVSTEAMQNALLQIAFSQIQAIELLRRRQQKEIQTGSGHDSIHDRTQSETRDCTSSPGRGQELSDTLPWIFRFHSTDPRDKIFALLNLVGPSAREHYLRTIPVSYDAPIEQVYACTMRQLFREQRSFSLLRHAGLGSRVQIGPDKHKEIVLPSWVASWRKNVGESESQQSYSAATEIEFGTDAMNDDERDFDDEWEDENAELALDVPTQLLGHITSTCPLPDLWQHCGRHSSSASLYVAAFREAWRTAMMSLPQNQSRTSSWQQEWSSGLETKVMPSQGSSRSSTWQLSRAQSRSSTWQVSRAQSRSSTWQSDKQGEHGTDSSNLRSSSLRQSKFQNQRQFEDAFMRCLIHDPTPLKEPPANPELSRMFDSFAFWCDVRAGSSSLKPNQAFTNLSSSRATLSLSPFEILAADEKSNGATAWTRIPIDDVRAGEDGLLHFFQFADAVSQAMSCADGDASLFAIMDDGSMATVPLETKVGDEVRLVASADRPFVMRIDKNGDGVGDIGGSGTVESMEDGSARRRRRLLVGPCFVQGAMKGEGATGPWDQCRLV